MSADPAALDSLFSSERVEPRRRERWTLSEYERLDRDASRIAENVRRVIDEWYRRLPAHSRPEVCQRFRSPSLGAHLGAFWEIYLHEATTRLGFEVDIDVGRDDARRRPDLLVQTAGTGFYVEATVALGDGIVARDERARADQLYAAIERVNNRDFLLHTTLRRVGLATPGRKLIAAPLDRWLGTLDPDEIRRLVDTGGPPPATTIDGGGWLVDIEATAKRIELRGDPEMGVIGSRVEGFATDAPEEDLPAALDDVTPLTNVLLKKAGHRYELEDRPFVLAVLCAGDLVAEHDIAQALFGPIGYHYSETTGRTTGRYLPGGLWHDGAGPRYANVSAVLTAQNLTPRATASVEPRLWVNPDARNRLDPAALPWRCWEVASDGRLIDRPSRRTAADVFALPADWPARDSDQT